MKLDKAYALELKRKFDDNGGSTPADLGFNTDLRTMCHVAWLSKVNLTHGELSPEAREERDALAAMLDDSESVGPIRLNKAHAVELGKQIDAGTLDFDSLSIRDSAHIGWMVRENVARVPNPQGRRIALGFAELIDDGASEAKPNLFNAVNRLPWWFVLAVSGLLLYVTYLAFGS